MPYVSVRALPADRPSTSTRSADHPDARVAEGCSAAATERLSAPRLGRRALAVPAGREGRAAALASEAADMPSMPASTWKDSTSPTVSGNVRISAPRARATHCQPTGWGKKRRSGRVPARRRRRCCRAAPTQPAPAGWSAPGSSSSPGRRRRGTRRARPVFRASPRWSRGPRTRTRRGSRWQRPPRMPSVPARCPPRQPRRAPGRRAPGRGHRRSARCPRPCGGRLPPPHDEDRGRRRAGRVHAHVPGVRPARRRTPPDVPAGPV